ncbi:RTA1 like protein-domain-containing protein [Podospora australis]|uniref:RTA1 like protein-domain-containing protein n=1 Tax=Podospora australis TaxID=1536484 RepID=A0AAN6X3T2_9PEZI|nr:RTA1 like protein-domain-containing protein [Podospora australis]
MSGDGSDFPPPPEGYVTWGLFCAKNKDDPICVNVRSHYEHVPSTAANAIFAAIFGLSFIGFVAVYFGTRRRGTFFTVTMCLGNLCEILGYVARVLSSKNPWEDLGFLMQIVCLTIGPAFLAAGVYTCLAKVVIIYGEENSRVKAAWYTRIFIPCDVVSLVLQAAGGAMAASAEDGEYETLDMGTNIMIAGLAFQVFTMLMFSLCAIDFGLRVMRRRSRLGREAFDQSEPARSIRSTFMFRAILVALTVSTLTILWRSAYRTAELSEGWDGPLLANEGLFIAFEGVLIAVAVLVLNVFHPSLAFGEVMDGKYQMVRNRKEDSGSSEDASEMAMLGHRV